MYSAISQSEKDLSHEVDQLDEFIKYSFDGFVCIQVSSDQSPFADHFFNLISQCMSTPPMIHGEWTSDMGCEGFVVITSSPLNIVPEITKLPLFNEHRFLAFVPHFSLAALNKEVGVFGDADILIMSGMNFTTAVRLGQPQRDEFEVVNNFTEPWTVDEFIREFYGRKIKALTYNCSLFSNIGPLNPDGSANYTYGAEIEIFNEITETLNITVEWHVMKDLKVQTMFFNTKKWYMDPITQQGKPTSVDVAFCGLTLSHKKMLIGALDMSEPLILLCFQFLVPRPKTVQSEWNSIFQVFSIRLWGIIGIVLLVTSVVLQRITTMTQKYVQTSGIQRYTKLGGSTLQLLSILVLGDVPKSQKSQGASRFILTSWSFSAMIITTVFSSGLVSHLTTQQYGEKMDTIEKLVKHKFHWGFQYKPDFSELLNIRENVDHARLRMRAEYFSDPSEYIKELRTGKYFLWGVQILEWFFIPEEEIPDFILDKFEVANDCFIDYYLGFAFREGSVFSPAFNKYIGTYKETGLMKKMFSRKFGRYARTRRYSRSVLEVTVPKLSSGRLRLNHLTGIIEVWAVGMGVSFIVFILEVLQKCHI
ncbi:Hypothetical protein NTJ_10586 [Nesidiocoris tenuis]|uniref:Ionotropic glutamate receptor C-terminal domain-containing protein n=1 Tax=Nesidiocoris tenuis TaxID=355587 RepID=A0ABN7B2C0_9HEMI|nr:Hypothetical protein NTJ_10586 [Nesidiocoris tenuis]